MKSRAEKISEADAYDFTEGYQTWHSSGGDAKMNHCRSSVADNVALGK